MWGGNYDKAKLQIQRISKMKDFVVKIAGTNIPIVFVPIVLG